MKLFAAINVFCFYFIVSLGFTGVKSEKSIHHHENHERGPNFTELATDDVFTEADKNLRGQINLEDISLVPTAAPTLSAAPTISLQPTQPTPVPSTLKPTPGKPTRAPTISIYADNPSIYLSQTAQQIIVALLTVLLFVFMVLETLSPEVLFLIALVFIMLCQILTLSETLSGFSNDSMITIGALFLVIGAVEKSHIVDFLARKAFGMSGSVNVAKARMYCTCFCLSIFFNNTPLVAILLPVVKDWGRVRNVAASQLLIPLSYSVLAGSFGSMIGTSSNLTIQGLMQADRNYSFTFFAPAPIGFPLFFLMLVYQLVAGPYLLPDQHSGLLRAVRDKAESLMAEVFVSSESPFVGKSLEIMMNSLGISPSRVIKIRRKLGRGKLSPNDSEYDFATAGSAAAVDSAKDGDSNKNTRRTEMFDSAYINRATPFWAPSSTTKPDGAVIDSDTHSAPYRRAASTDSGGIELAYMEEGRDSPTPPRSAARKRTSSGHIIEYADIIAPASMEIVGAEDIVFISSAQDVMEKLMKSIAGESKGLYIMDSNVLSLPGYGSELVECVISDSNPFIGEQISDIAVQFAEKYKAGIITARGKDWVTTQESDAAAAATSAAASGTASATGTGTRGVATSVGAAEEKQRAAKARTDSFEAIRDSFEAIKKSTTSPGTLKSRKTAATGGGGSVAQKRPSSSSVCDGDVSEVGDGGGVTPVSRESGIDDDTELLHSLKKNKKYNTEADTGAAAAAAAAAAVDALERSGFDVGDSGSNKHSDGDSTHSGDGDDCDNSGLVSGAAAAHKTVSDHVINIGDVILCVTNSKQVDALRGNRDFFVVSTVGELPIPMTLYSAIPVVVFIIMLLFVALELIDMCPAALTVTCFFFMGGWLTHKDIARLVDIRLLMLMGTSLSFAKAITKSGLALLIAEAIASGNQTHFQSLLLVYIVTLLVTELISNNAAGAMMYPIAVALADELGVSFIPFAMAVLIACTAGFMCPIGYQTHVMVWGPGGYKFKDFVVFGLIPDVMYWIVGCAIISWVYPF